MKLLLVKTVFATVFLLTVYFIGYLFIKIGFPGTVQDAMLYFIIGWVGCEIVDDWIEE